MRILSQDGRIDIPYDDFVFSITKDNCITATRDSVATLSEIAAGVVAEYSTETKARKAMEMLREAYSPVLVIKEQQEGIKPNIKPNYFVVGSISPMPKVEVLDNFYFQFPQDSEIEV